MTRRLLSLVSILAMAGALLTACGSDDTTTVAGESPGTSDPTGTTPPDTAGGTGTSGGTDTSGGTGTTGEVSTVYAVLVGGGFVPVEVALAEAPGTVILSDGTVYRPGAVPAIFPGPALPAVETTTLEPAELDEVLAIVDTHRDLFDGTDFGQPAVSDLPTTTVTAVVDGELAEAAAYALDLDLDVEPAPALTPEQTAAREELSTLIADVQAIVDDPGREWQFADPTAMLARSYPPVEQTDVDPGPPVEFPIDDAGALSTARTGFGCMQLVDEELELVLDAARDATQITPWVVGEETVQIVLRPLHPHEPGCSG